MLKVEPYQPGRVDKRSDAQKAAHARNFKVFNLRGLASMRFRLTGPRRDALLDLVDAELALIGAKPTVVHEMERDAEQERRWAAATADHYDDIPF